LSEQPIADEELVDRHIPNAEKWFEPPDRMTSANFKLRKGELGLSVYRARLVTVGDVLSRLGSAGSHVAQSQVGTIRSARNAAGDDLHLDVIAVDDETNPGHAEIRGPQPGKIPAAAAKALRDLFRLVPAPAA
jgi:hypothetical protein